MYDNNDSDQIDEIFRALCNRWHDQIAHAKKDKRKRFSVDADEALQFYNGPKDWMQLMGKHGGFLNDEDAPEPMFRISVNKAFEFVSIFGPALYYENPVRTVKPRMPVDIPPEFLGPAFGPDVYANLIGQEQARVKVDGLRASLIGTYLNWTPNETGLAEESRLAIEEALIKGRSCCWTELYRPPGADFNMVRSSWDSVDNLYVDPDATSLDKAQWIARRCVHPVWQVEQDYGLKRGTLKANAESYMVQADIETNEEAQERRRQGRSNDLLVYYKVWSKMGIGGRLPGTLPQHRRVLEMFGDYAYIVFAPDTNFPLNLPPHLLDEAIDPQEIKDRVFGAVAWPTPFWAYDSWPVSCIDFCRVPNSPWPMPPLKAGMGELRFLNWATSFLCGHVRNTARDFLVMFKGLPEETKATLLGGKDLEVIELDASFQGKSLSDLVQFLQHPQMNADIWKVIEAVEKNFDKRVGLTELMYGTTGVQLRSAEEAALKQQNMSVRPEDMAKQVETWQAEIASKEAMAARFHLTRDDVAPVMGNVAAFAWETYVSTRDPQAAARQLDYQIESGSTQKPNKTFEVKQSESTLQALLPVFQQYLTQTGDPTPMNNLLSDYAKAHDLDPSRYQLTAPMPPPPISQPPGGPDSVQQEPTDNPIPAG